MRRRRGKTYGYSHRWTDEQTVIKSNRKLDFRKQLKGYGSPSHDLEQDFT